MTAASRSIVLGSLLGAGLACEPAAPPPERTSRPLAEALASTTAEVAPERMRAWSAIAHAKDERTHLLIDFGHHAARPFLGDGWGRGEIRRDHSVRWTAEGRATVALDLRQAQSLQAVARLELPPDRPSTSLAVEANGRAIATLAPTPGLSDHTWVIPASATRAGPNELAFVAADGGTIGWHGLRLEAPPLPPGPSALPGADATCLPEGTTLVWDSRVGPDAHLGWTRAVAATEGAPPSLSIDVEPAAVDGAGGDEDAIDVALPAGPQRVPLAAEPGTIRVRIRVDPVAGDDRFSRCAVELHGAALSWRDERPGAGARAPPHDLGQRPAAKPYDVLLYVVDTVRADRLGAYGYTRPTSPELDAFARESVVFENAQANTAWTRAAVASMLTGLLPWSHGTTGRLDSFSPPVPTLAERLKAAGYRTAAVVTNGNVSQDFAFDRGFDTFEYLREGDEVPRFHRTAAEVHEVGLAWLDRAGTQAPVLLYLHATDPHAPYVPSEPFRTRFAGGIDDPDVGTHEFMRQLGRGETTASASTREALSDLYDAEIAEWDRDFGALLDALAARDRLDDMVIVLVSDHGEELADHGGWGHGHTLYQEQLGVPLIVRFPGAWAGGLRSRRLAEHVDILPTVLDLIGSPAPEPAQGDSLLGSLGTAAPPDDAAFAHLALDGSRRESIRTARHKLIRRPPAPDEPTLRPVDELFDVAADPVEAVQLREERPVVAGRLRARLDRKLARLERPPRPPQAEIDAALEAALRQLGYIED